MKKVIDANFFGDPELADYLKSDKRNLVIFPDYACMEAYKGNALKNISKSIETVSQFPDQVIILKGTCDIVKLSLLPDGLRMFEDPIQTAEFKTFCILTRRAIQGDQALAQQILQKGKDASEHFAKLQGDADVIAQGIEELTKSFETDHLRALRKQEEFQAEHIHRMLTDILLVAALIFQDHPDLQKIPTASQLPNSYILRFAVGTYILALQWISDGGARHVKREKLRNDIVDMHYVAYATFYDGLLTRDNKMMRIYDETCFILRNFFSPA